MIEKKISIEEKVLNTFIGKDIKSINIGLCSAVLHFESNCSVHLENEVHIYCKKKSYLLNPEKPTTVSPLLMLIGLKVTSFKFDEKEKHIYLFFENDIELVVWHVYDGYESYYVSTPDGFFVALEQTNLS